MRAVDIGDFNGTVYPPGATPGVFNVLAPLLWGLAVGAGSVAACVWATRRRLGAPLTSRARFENEPADAVTITLERSARTPAIMLVLTSAALAGASIVTGMIVLRLPATPELFGPALAAAIVTALMAGAGVQALRALRRPPRAWLTQDAMVIRDPRLFTRDCRIPRPTVEGARRKAEADVDAACLSPYEQKGPFLLVILRSPVTVDRLRTGLTGGWLWDLTANEPIDQRKRYLSPAPAPFTALLLKSPAPDDAVTAINAWALPAPDQGAKEVPAPPRRRRWRIHRIHRSRE
ncbi:hypothetical protein [Thermomonospora umbrina]|uniref:hypothetical protein n=1 Tax=Thermomonospora umbrina TaxID=111806 RepID=UPI000E226651|nr:hypothetical protein [Thermomonospora umbrina]